MENKHHDNDQRAHDHWQVVMDTEGHFSVWPRDRSVPISWEPNGYVGTRDACLAEISRIWTDPRPQALRTAMASSTNF
ncbi:MbtH family NRPS accessory protein [Rhizobium sp.]|jgi:MbtH protein|uniref:MbtH family NRPS accessory protein n=1 Tax=Rhizobium sp. TaxID=391 RepID=UPI000E918EA0|nr:polyketide synthase [Rhizobium sp.]